MDGDSALPKTFLWKFSPHYVYLVPGFILLFIIHFSMTKLLLRVNDFCSGFTSLLIFHERVKDVRAKIF